MNLADLFKLATLTASVNTLPTPPSRLGDSGLFQEEGITSSIVAIEHNQGRLSLVPAASRNDDGQAVARGKRKRRTFEVPHLPQTDSLLPAELQGVAAFGEEDVTVGQAKVINNRLQTMKNNLAATREWQRAGAINGKILDADGSVIYDLFAEFGVAEQQQICALSTAGTDVRGKLVAAKRLSEAKLDGFVITGWKCYSSPEFFDSFVGHNNVKAAYANYAAAADKLAGDLRKGFTFAEITFEEYSAKVSGNSYIAAGHARLVPIVAGLYKLWNAPANYNETVNTVGQAYYAKAEERRLGKGWDLEAQSNPLALSLVPDSLIDLVIA